MIPVLRTSVARERRLLVARLGAPPPAAGVEAAVAETIAAVRARGDIAVAARTERFDGVRIPPVRLRVPEREIAAASREVDRPLADAIRLAWRRLLDFHLLDLPRGVWSAEGGTVLGLLVRPLARVGIYVPGGSAPLFSTLLMCAAAARAAGVEEIAVATPPRRDGRVDARIRFAAGLCGVTDLYRMGGAQAVAALAYGTRRVRRVEKIVGPGNRWVVEAKRQVFGAVGIDSLAGPSEICVVADSTADPACVAADLVAQAEHDADARAVCLTPDRRLAAALPGALRRALRALPRAAVARRSLDERGAVGLCRSLDEALDLADLMAPEHLELSVADPWGLIGRVRRAGAVFVGGRTPETLGDYVLGPNHVLPTAGTARFASPLGVRDFVRSTSVMEASDDALRRLGPAAARLAAAEGLAGHAAAVRARLRR